MESNSTTKTVTIHQSCNVAPPSTRGETTEQTLPLTYFDILWLFFHPIQRLIFYRFPCSRAHFLETLVPNLKTSLSEILKHYKPLAGNLYLPLNSGVPEVRYGPGDSITLTIAEASEAHDFTYLTGNQARNADEFYAFVPNLPEPKIDSISSFNISHLLAVQVTLFPETGICIGFSNHHVIGDASSIVGFIKGWSLVSKLEGDFDNEVLAKTISLPFYDRSVIKDPSGRASIFWNQMKQRKIFEIPLPKFPTNKLRETFILQKTDIQNLRTSISAKRPDLTHLSSFTIIAAYVWSCFVKSAVKIGEEIDENEPEYFVIAVDARHRIDPKVPASYFGNCLAAAVTESTHGQLKGDDGFCIGVDLIGALISKRVNNKEEILRGADDWLVNYGPLFGKRVFGVAGSPKFDLYDTDFGWGTPSKYEAISIDGDSSMSLCKSREFEGGLEIGLSLLKVKLDAFATIFYDGLKM